MPAKYSGMRVSEGDVQVFYGPCGGGYGDPLERPPETVLDDVLDGFCTVEHARDIYGVVVDLEAETVDDAATATRRQDMRADPRPIPEIEATVGVRRAPEISPPTPITATPQPSLPPVASPPPAPNLTDRADPSVPAAPAAPSASRSGDGVDSVVRSLREAYGDNWSFEIVDHDMNGDTVTVRGQVTANGAQIQETGTAERRQRDEPSATAWRPPPTTAWANARPSCSDTVPAPRRRVAIEPIGARFYSRRRTREFTWIVDRLSFCRS